MRSTSVVCIASCSANGEWGKRPWPICQESRGPVLIKEGQPRRYRYRFAVPLLRAFILLKGVADQRITPDELR